MGVWFLFEILLLISRGYIFRSGILDSYGNSVFNFEELPYCFPQWLDHFTFPLTGPKGPNFCSSSPTLVILFTFSSIFHSIHPNGFRVGAFPFD